MFFRPQNHCKSLILMVLLSKALCFDLKNLKFFFFLKFQMKSWISWDPGLRAAGQLAGWLDGWLAGLLSFSDYRPIPKDGCLSATRIGWLFDFVFGKSNLVNYRETLGSHSNPFCLGGHNEHKTTSVE